MSNATYWCPICQADKPAADFYASRTTSYRPVQGYCRACSRRKQLARWRALNQLRRLHQRDYDSLLALYLAELETEPV